MNQDNCLLHVLGELNRHARKLAMTDDQMECSYSGLSITSMTDRNSRLPVNKLANVPNKHPLMIMHLGFERNVNIIPKKLGSSMNDVYTISLGNFSTLTILPEARVTYNFTLPAEGSAIANSDYHVFLIPVLESEPAVVATDSYDQEDLEVTVLEVKHTYDPDDAISNPDENVVNYSEPIESNENVANYTDTEPIDSKVTTDKVQLTDLAEIPSTPAEETPPVHDAQSAIKPAEETDLATLADAPAPIIDTIAIVDKLATEADSVNKNIPVKPVVKHVDATDPDENTEIDSAKIIDAARIETLSTETIPTVDADTAGCENTPTELVFKPVETTDTDEKAEKPEIDSAEITDAARIETLSAETTPTVDVVIAGNKKSPTELVAVVKPVEATDPAKESDIPKNDPPEVKTDPSGSNDRPNQTRGFIQQSIYEDIISQLASKTCKAWAKECDIPHCATATDVKKLLTKRIESAKNNDATLPMKFLEKLVGKMNDSAVQVELFNFYIQPKDGAKARKNQLLSYLCERFSKPYISSPNKVSEYNKTNLLYSSSKSTKKRKRKYPKDKTPRKVANTSDHTATPRRRDSVKHTNPRGNIIRRVEASEEPSNEPPSPGEVDDEKLDQVVEKEEKHKTKEKKKQGNKRNENTETSTSSSTKKSPCDETLLQIRTLDTGIVGIQKRLSGLEASMNTKVGKLGRDETVEKLCLNRISDLEENNKTFLLTLSEQQAAITSLIHDVLELRSAAKSTTLHPPLPDPLPEAPNSHILALEARIKSLEMTKASLESSVSEYKHTIAEMTAYNKRLFSENEYFRAENQDLEEEAEGLKKQLNTLLHPVRNNESMRLDILVETKRQVETKADPGKPSCSSHLVQEETTGEIEVISGIAEVVDVDSYLTREKAKTKEIKLPKNVDISNKNNNSTKIMNNGLEDNQACDKDNHCDERGKGRKPAQTILSKTKTTSTSEGSTITDLPKITKSIPQDQVRPAVRKQIPGGSNKTRSSPAEPSVDKHNPGGSTNNNMVNADSRERPRSKNLHVNQHSSPTQCLLVHDTFHSDFNAHRFTRRFNMSFLRMSRLNQVLQSGCVTRKIKQLKPAVTVLHIGHQDLWDGKSVDDVLESIKILTHKVLEETETRLCISLVIPVSGYSQLTEKINDFNWRVSRFIRTTRSILKYQDRLYSTDNNRLGDYTKRSVGATGVEMKLNERGNELLWLRLRDSIDRTLGVEMRGRITYRRKDLDQKSDQND